MINFRIVLAAMVLCALAACGPDVTVPSGSSTETVAQAPTQTAADIPGPSVPETIPETTESPASPSPEEPAIPESTEVIPEEPEDPAPVLPQEFEGLWTSVAQGSAETVFRFRSDGSYDKVSILLQQRPSGLFSFTITASGYAALSDDLLVLTPVKGTQTMEDPDSPSSNFDKPLEDLTPEEYAWAFENGQLILTGEYGTVAYTWEPDR